MFHDGVCADTGQGQHALSVSRSTGVLPFASAVPFAPITDSDAFAKAVVLGATCESRFLEFKAEYRWQKAQDDHPAEQAVELCRDVAQFANGEGGTVLVGVEEDLGRDGRKVAARVRSVDSADGFKQWVEQAIRNHLAPATFTRSVDIIAHGAAAVVAINVPPSLRLVALWHPQRKNGIEYLFRTDHGKEWMNPDEVERHLMDGARASRLAVRRVWDEITSGNLGDRMLVLVPPVELRTLTVLPRKTLVDVDGDGRASRPQLAGLREHEVEVQLLNDNRPEIHRIPYTLIRDAWTTVDGRPALSLAIRIVRTGQGFHFEPL